MKKVLIVGAAVLAMATLLSSPAHAWDPITHSVTASLSGAGCSLGYAAFYGGGYDTFGHTIIQCRWTQYPSGQVTYTAPGYQTFYYPSPGSYSVMLNVQASCGMWSTNSASLNFTVAPILHMSTTTGGTTTPAPGSHDYALNSTVTLTAIPNTGYVFDQWSGDASGTSTTTSITMSGNKSVTASFTPSVTYYTLNTTVQPSGGGGVVADPTGPSYASGTSVTLTADPCEGYLFDHWSNNVTGTGAEASITMYQNETVTAYFVAGKVLDGSANHGTLSASVSGGDPCELPQTYLTNTDVIVTVTPDEGYDDVVWTGSAVGRGKVTPVPGNALQMAVTMDDNYTIYANCDPRIIYVSKHGDNSDGVSWPTAYQNIAAAASQATRGDQIWVAAGTYAEDATIPSGVRILGGFPAHGGSLYTRNSSLFETIVDGTFDVQDCDASTLVDGFVFCGPLSYGDSSTGIAGSQTELTIRDCVFDDQGSWLYECTYTGIGVSGSPVVQGCVFGCSYAMVLEYGNPTIEDCYVGGGTGVHLSGCTGATISGLTASQVNGCDDDDDRMEWVIKAQGCSGTVTIQDVYMTECQDSGIEIEGGSDLHVAIADSEFYDNICASRPTYLGGGNGVIMFNSPGGSLEVQRCIFSGNLGGGVDSTKGGCVYAGAGECTLNRCTFESNYGYYPGSAVYTDAGSDVTIQSCIFRDNTSTQSGGAIYVGGGATDVVACALASNVAASSGGALMSTGGTLNVVNCLITNNRSANGGAACSNGATTTISNSTICRNSVSAGNYGGVLADLTSGSLTVMNCILYDNTTSESVVTEQSQIAWSNGTPVVDYCHISDDIEGLSGSNNTIIDTDDPLFAGSSDYRLAFKSQCVDNGSGTGAPETDIIGNPRVFGSAIDRGAYESQEPTTNYALITTSTEGGVVIVSDQKLSYVPSTSVTLTARADSEHAFDGWTGTFPSQDNPLTFTITADTTLNAVFVDAYTASITANNCTVIANPPGPKYKAGTTVTLTAFPKTGYHFVAWKEGGSDISTSPYIELLVNGSRSVTAECAINMYGLSRTVTSGDGSIVATPNATDYAHGTTVTLSAVPGSDYRFKQWSGDTGSSNILASSIAVVMNGEKSIGATFVPVYTLSVGGDNCIVNASPLKAAYNSGDLVTLTAVPDEGYEFVGWTGAELTGNPVELTVTENVEVTANCTIKEYTLTHSVSPSESGNVAPPEGDYDHGTNVALTATPEAGYRFDKWTGDYTSRLNPLGIRMTGDVEVTANFVAAQCTLSGSTDGGTLTPTLPYTCAYSAATPVTITLVHPDGRSKVEWSGSAVSMGKTSSPVTERVGDEVHSTINVFMDGDYTLFARCTASIVYVSQDGDDDDDGLSWATAFRTVQTALDWAASEPVDQIWVAAGTYYPDEGYGQTDDDQSATFEMVPGVTVYGGFSGGETSLDQRFDIGGNPTILSGYILASDTNPMPDAGHSHHVVKGADGAVLDGFIIRGGYVDDGTAGGAGLYCLNSSPTVRNCVFTLNWAAGERCGGAIWTGGDSSPILVNCTIAGNYAEGNNAGGMYHSSTGTLRLTNCTVADNVGDGIHSTGGSLVLDNCILWRNRFAADDAAYPVREVVLTNTTATVDYSVVESGLDGIVGVGDTGVTMNWGAHNVGTTPSVVEWGLWKWVTPDGDLVDNGASQTQTDDVSSSIVVYDFKVNHADMQKGSTDHNEDDFVGDTLNTVTRNPVWDPTPSDTSTVSNEYDFNSWFSTQTYTNKSSARHPSHQMKWVCVNSQKAEFRLTPADLLSDHFFPIDGWCAGGCGGDSECLEFCDSGELEECNVDGCSLEHNFFFTLVYRTQGLYIPGQTLHFEAADDLFVAINGVVVVNRAGYFAQCPSVTDVVLDNGNAEVTRHNYYTCGVDAAAYDVTLNLVPHTMYDLDIFFAQRRTPVATDYSGSVLVVEATPGEAEVAPCFVAGDYHLQSDSPCIDTGYDAAVPAGTLIDLDGKPRFCKGNASSTARYVDMGCYEYQTLTARDDSYTCYDGQTLTIDAAHGVMANDAVISPTGSPVSKVQDVEVGSLALDTADGSFTYTPTTGFSGTVSFVYRLTDTSSNTDDATVTIAVKNTWVDAGEDRILEVSATTGGITEGDPTLRGSVSNDLGDPAPEAVLWTLVSAPTGGSVRIQSESTLVTPLEFASPAVGRYSFTLTAVYDGGYETSDFVTIILRADAPVNRTPTVSAGSYSSVPLSYGRLQLRGTVRDDGLPSVPGIVTTTWSCVAHNASDDPYFVNVNALDTDFEFSTPGIYILRLEADDGAATAVSLAEIVVTDNSVGNTPPAVYAGRDRQLAPLSYSVSIDDAEVFDAETPVASLAIRWSVASGDPTAIYFSTITAVNPVVKFSKAGTYTLRLTAEDESDGCAYGDVVIMVSDELPPIQDFTVSAGQDQAITLPAAVTLAGEVTAAGFDKNDVLLRWLMTEGPADVIIADDTTEAATITVTRPGIYVFALTGRYGTVEKTATAQVTVMPGKVLGGGEDHTLIVDDTAGRYVWACGLNGYDSGILGQGSGFTRVDLWLPHQVLRGENPDVPLDDVTAVASGWLHSLALDTDGRVWAWGLNHFGQLGYPTNWGEPWSPVAQIVQAGEQNSTPGEPLTDIVAIATGRSGTHSLAVSGDGCVWAWGNSHFGCLGIGTDYSDTSRPCQVHGPDASEISDHDLPAGSAFLTGIAAVSGGAYHSLALEKIDPANDCFGRVYSFGANDWYFFGSLIDYGNGLLGNGVESTDYWSYLPVCVHAGDQNGALPDSALKDIVMVSAGWYHNIALHRSGKVYTWGWNGAFDYEPYHFEDRPGRIGNGTFDDSQGDTAVYARPVSVVADIDSDGLSDGLLGEVTPAIIAVSAAASHSMALDAEGNVWTWGSNFSGQLGLGVDESELPRTCMARRVVGVDGSGHLGQIVAISAGYWHCLAMDSSGRVYSWGWGYRGRLGIGTEESMSRPVLLPPLGGARVKNITKSPIAWYETITEAIGEASDGDEIVIYPGRYPENVFIDKSITLRGLDPCDPSTVAATIIGAGISAFYTVVVDEQHLEAGVINLEGVTLRGGEGYGFYCWTPGKNVTGNITNCIIADNPGGGLFIESSAPWSLTGNLIRNNHYISGWLRSPVTFVDNVVEDNEGNGIQVDDPVYSIERNLVCNNSGFGIYATTTGIIGNNVVCGNGGTGIIVGGTTSKVMSNLIYQNKTGIRASDDENLILNNTIVHNVDQGIDSEYVQPIIRNCIVFGNGATHESNIITYRIIVSDRVTYSCIQDGETNYDGEGNISISSTDLVFAAGTSADVYRLRRVLDNPCIDVGYPGNYSGELDIDGQARVMGVAVDIGADELSPYSVTAGEDKTAIVAQRLYLSDAMVACLSTGSSAADLQMQWAVVRQPYGSSVLFSLPDGSGTDAEGRSLLNPGVSFSQIGTYILSLTLKELGVDGAIYGRDYLTVAVLADVGLSVNLAGNPTEFELDFDDVLLGFTKEVPLRASATGVDPCGVYMRWSAHPSVQLGAIVDNSAGAEVVLERSAAFSRPGIYPLTVEVYDNTTHIQVGKDTLLVTIRHPSMTISAGNDQTRYVLPSSVLNEEVSLSGAVEGIPDYTVRWECASLDDDDFSDVDSKNTTVTLTQCGIYYVNLVVTDTDTGEIVGGDTVVISILPSAVSVNAGVITSSPTPEKETTIVIVGTSAMATLTGTIVPNEGLSVRWMAPHGAPVTFGNANNVSTTATFTSPGIYQLALLAMNGDDILGYDTVLITVEGGGTPYESPIVVSAGGEYIAWVDQPITLYGSATDIEPPVIASHVWVFQGDSGLVTIPEASNYETTATFSCPGYFEIGLEAYDGSEDLIAVDVAKIYVYHVPSITAGPDKTVVRRRNGVATVHLTGTVAGTLPDGCSERWVCEHSSDYVSLPTTSDGIAELGSLSSYTLKLQVVDSLDNVVAEDDMTVAVKENTKPSVQILSREAWLQLSSGSCEYSLRAFAVDVDGPEESLDCEWSSIPSAGVSFTGTWDNCTAQFTAVGDYELKLAVDDGGYGSPVSDTVLVHVLPAGDPILSAGNYGAIYLACDDKAFLSLDKAFQVGMPKNTTYQWSETTATGQVCFISASSLNTVAQFKDDGTYELQLQASNGAQVLETSNTFVTVLPATEPFDNVAPTLSIVSPTGEPVPEPLIVANISALDEGIGLSRIKLETSVDAGPWTDVEVRDYVPDFPTDEVLLTSKFAGTVGTSVQLRVTATDRCGNASVQTTSFSVTSALPDTNPVIVKPEAPSIDSTTQATGPLTVVDEGNYQVEIGLIAGKPEYCLQLYNGTSLVKNLTSTSDWPGAAPGLTSVDVDFSDVENGVYTLWLTTRADDSDTDYRTDSVKFVLDSPLKIGNVKFSQEDIAVPVGQFPLRVIRTYNSLRRNIAGDFGYGWSYTLANAEIDLAEQRVEMQADSWYGGSDTYAMVRAGDNYGRDVTLTLPNGQRTTFGFYLDYDEGNIEEGALPSYRATYAPAPGISATLEAQTDGGNTEAMVLTAGGESMFTWIWKGQPSDMTDPAQHDFGRYILTTDDGTKYIFSRSDHGEYEIFTPDGGYSLCWARPRGTPYLSQILLPSGETVCFGVEDLYGSHPAATSVEYFMAGETEPAREIEIVRDGDRIIAVQAPGDDPCKPSLKYAYDGYGNLEYVYRLVDAATASGTYEKTQYVYESDGPGLCVEPADHYIAGMKDDRGLTPIMYKYDDQGRLIATVDAKGNEISISHNAGSNTEVVTDRSGNVTIYEYNDRGNVVSITDSLSRATIYVYDDPDYRDGATKVKVPLVANPDPYNDDHYAITQTDYDGSGRALSVIDPELNRTDYTYDGNGNVLTTAQSKWNTTEYVPISRTVNTYVGNRLKTTETQDPANSSTRLSMAVNLYDNKGRIGHTINVNLNAVSDVSPFYNLTYDPISDTIRDDYADQHAVTSYTYSGESPEPESVTDPAGVTRYSHYNESGAHDASWRQGPNGKWVTNLSRFDAQGRTIATYRVTTSDTPAVSSYLNGYFGTDSAVQLSSTAYNSIGKVDYSLGFFEWTNNGDVFKANITLYCYDELGNAVETWNGLRTKAAGMAPVDTWLTVSRILYDAEGRMLVSAGPYDLADGELPVGTETVYDSLGRAVETRRWAGVDIQLEDLVSNGVVVGRKTVTASNAWDGNGDVPATGWTSNGKLPVVKATIDAPTEQGPLSYSRSVFDTAGRVKHSITLDESGTEQPTSYEYDKAGRQIVVIDPLGHYISNPNNNLLTGSSSIALSDGTVSAVRINFDNFDGNTYVEPSGTGNFTGTHSTTTHYDGQQRDSITDALGHEVFFGYDEVGRLIWTQYPETEYVSGFDTDGLPTMGTSHTYTHVGYDSMGRKVWESEPVTAVDAASVNPDTQAKQFGYDTLGRLTSVTLPAVDDPEDSPDAGETVHPVYRYYYDRHGNQTGIVDPKLRLSVFAYDEQGRQVRKYMPFVITTADVVDLDASTKDVDDLLVSASPTPLCEQRFYNSFGRLESSIDCKGQETIYSYYDRTGVDDNGTPADTTDDAYGRAGQLWYQAYYDTSSVLGKTVRYSYDTIGRRDKVYIDGVLSEQYNYTPTGQLSDIAYTGVGNVHYEYDPITGQKLNTVANDGSVTDTQYTHDALGRLATIQGKSDAIAAEYTYDAAGSRESLHYPNGNYAQHDYDALNRLTNLTYHQNKPVNGQPAPTILSIFSYNLLPNGRRARAVETDHSSQQTAFVWRYDNLNRLEVETCSDAVGVSALYYQQEYTYDTVGNRKERVMSTYDSGIVKTGEVVTTYTYYPGTDCLHEEINVHTTTCIAKHPDGTVYACAIAGGISYFRADGGRISSFRAWLLGMPAKWPHYAFILMLSLIPVIPVSPLFTRLLKHRGSRHEYGEPSAWQKSVCVLLAYCILMGPGVSEVLAVDSLLYINFCPTAWGVDGTTIVYQYDGNGSVTEKKTITTGSSPEEVLSRTAYIYDLTGRLAEVQEKSPDGATVLSWMRYTYSTDGIRIKTEDSASIVKTFLADPANGTGYAQVLEEYDGTTRTSYVIGDDVLAQRNGTSQPQYLIYDGHGSTRQLADASGNIVENYSYDAYGMAVGFVPSASATKMLYCGEQYDSSLSQYYLRARYYDQSNGRFTTLDPYAGDTSDPQSLHKYTYCHNDPANGVDPSGLFFGDFTLPGLLRNAVISAVIDYVLMPALLPLISTAASLLIPQSVRDALENVLPCAMLVGLNISMSAGWYASLGLTTGWEALWSPSGHAVYDYGGYMAGMSAGKNLSISGACYFGLVFQCLSSDMYEGEFNTITLAYKRLPSKIQQKMEEHITRWIGELILWPPNMTRADIIDALAAGPSRLAEFLSAKAERTISVSWASNGVIAVTLGTSFTVGQGNVISIAKSYYDQIYPEEPVDFSPLAQVP